MLKKSKGRNSKSLQIGTANQNAVKVPNLIKTRDGTFAFRRVVPPDVRPTLLRSFPSDVGKPNIYVSLGRDRKVAEIKALQLNAEWEEIILNERRRLDGLSEVRITANDGIRRMFRNLSEMSQEEVEGLIKRFFVELELGVSDFRRTFYAIPAEERAEVYESSSGDLTHYQEISQRNDDYGLVSNELSPFLRRRGIYVDDPGSEQSQYYAKLLISAHIEHLKRTLALFEGDLTGTFNPFFPASSVISDPKQVGEYLSEERCPTLSELCDEFLERKRQEEKGVKTLNNISPILNTMKEFFGSNTIIDRITTKEGEAFIKFLPTIPVNFRKRYPGKNVKTAALLESKLDEPLTISRNTVVKMFTWCRLCFEQAQSLMHLKRPYTNPLPVEYRKLLPKEQETVEEPEFSLEQLAAIFSSSQYREAFIHDKKRSKFWIPLLCLFQGFRLDEAAQLTVGNIIEKDGIKCIQLTTLAADKKTVIKTLKNKTSARDVPIHPEIINMGFLQFIDECRGYSSSPDQQLFPECPITSEPDKSVGTVAARWFREEVRDKLFDKGNWPGKRTPALHSLRHAWRTALRRARVPENEVEALGGWSTLRKSQQAHYGTNVMKHLHEDVCKVEYEGLDLNFYRYRTREVE